MANRKNQHIYSPSLSEYAFRALRSIKPEQKANLTIDELKLFETDYKLQKFIKEDGRLDYLLYLLSKVGISWTLRIERDAESTDLLEFNTQDQYRYPQKRVDITEATMREGTCVISSRDVMVLSHMLAQNCTTKVYSISEFGKILAKKMKDTKQLTSWDSEVVKAQEGYEIFNNILLEQLNSLDYAKDVLGLDDIDLRILAALYKKRNVAVKMNEITAMTKSSGKNMYFRKNMKKLLDEGLVASDNRNPTKLWANSVYFMITTAGLNKILSYQKLIHKNTFS